MKLNKKIRFLIKIFRFDKGVFSFTYEERNWAYRLNLNGKTKNS
tara:strand:+ start:1787 stop:1918 length:132 start_codon:yes stop_codon:yes gene_type:complete